tara:strand:+ start:6227 stop:7192 length:966 start_codon:yes stop_codon:yes gene_type:complete
MSDTDKVVESKDAEGNDVKVVIKKPSIKDIRDSQIEYNKSFKVAIDGGAILKKKLDAYLEEQDIWSSDKQTRYDEVMTQINDGEDALRKGGIPLGDAKNVAVEVRRLRNEFRTLIAEKSEMDSNTAESIADNSRFNFLVVRCVTDENKQRIFSSPEDYDAKSEQPWAFEAAAQLANIIYELDPDFNKNLEENRFLYDYKFCNDELQLVNKNSHPIDIDEDGNERLIDENGRYVAYKTEEAEKIKSEQERYFVNVKGEEVDKDGKLKVKFSPFLDDSGEAVTPREGASDEDAEASTEESSEEKKEKAPRKRATKAKKTTETT